MGPGVEGGLDAQPNDGQAAMMIFDPNIKVSFVLVTSEELVRVIDAIEIMEGSIWSLIALHDWMDPSESLHINSLQERHS